MSEHLCTCGRPVQDATLCTRCGLQLDALLAQISEHHGLGWDLDIAVARQARIDLPGGKVDLEPYDDQPGTLRPTPMPYDDRASKVAGELKNTLGTWARLVADETGDERLPADTITAIATWLRPRAGWLRHHEAGGEALDEIRDAVRAARRVIDRPADRLYAGPCQGCGTDLYARVEAVYVTCPTPDDECGVTYSVGDLRAWLLASAEDVLGTTTEISRALTRYAQPVTPSAIRGYVGRKALFPRGERMEGGRLLPLYRLGDVMKCAADALAARSERIGA